MIRQEEAALENLSQKRVLSDISAKMEQEGYRDGTAAELVALGVEVVKLVALLEKFRTVEQIVDYLRRSGIKGKIGILEACPLANIGKAAGVKVQVDNKGIGIGDSFRFGNEVVSEFVRRFDAGEYPDLIACED